MNNLITIGKITKQHGNKGELKVLPLTDFPERFNYLETVFLDNGQNTVQKKVERTRSHKKFIILKLDGVNNIGQAIVYKDYLLKVPDTELIPLREDQYYIYKLIGYKVYIKEGELLGSVKDIRKTGGTDIFIIKNEQKEYMIPAAKEFMTIDKGSHKIVINPIPGLLDI